MPIRGKIMREFQAGKFDVAVIGAGHAGIEAALAAARLGMETVIFTINLDGRSTPWGARWPRPPTSAASSTAF